MAAVGSHLGVLVAVCTFTCAVSFLVNFPSILSTPLQLYLNLPGPQYAYLVSALYTAYSTPNIFLPFFAGPLVRLCGERGALLLTFASVALGQMVLACSIQMRIESGMIAGRFLFGLGGEIICVLAYEILTRWFQKRFSMVLGIMISATNVVVTTASITIQRLSESHGIVASTWVATWVALAAGFSSICYLACIGREKPLDTESLLDSNSDIDNEEAAVRDASQAKPNCLKLIASYPYAFWLLGMICILGQGSIGTFGNSAQRFLASVFYAGDQRTAASALSVKVVVSSVAVFPLGYILDRSFFTRAPVVLLVANILIVFSHTLFLTTPSAILPLATLGLASAIYSVSFMSSLSHCLFATVESLQQARTHEQGQGQGQGQRRYDTIAKPTKDDKYSQEIITSGFGCMTSVANLACATIPILLAMAESAMGYKGLEMVFWVLGLLGCLVAGHLVFISRYIEL